MPDFDTAPGLLPLHRRRRRTIDPFVALARMQDRWRQRQDLGGLDDDALRDVGITRRQAAAEAARPSWR